MYNIDAPYTCNRYGQFPIVWANKGLGGLANQPSSHNGLTNWNPRWQLGSYKGAFYRDIIPPTSALAATKDVCKHGMDDTATPSCA